MHAPFFVRELTAAERRQLSAGLSSRDGFTLRRCQILLASAEGQRPAQIARGLGCSAGTVRNAFRAFGAEGLASLKAKSNRPRSAGPLLDAPRREQLKAILHQSPRQFGKPQSTWSLKLLAEVAGEEGLTPRVLSHEAMRRAIKRLNVGWKRAKRWITSPDPAYARKKTRGTG
jgi:transposase